MAKEAFISASPELQIIIQSLKSAVSKGEMDKQKVLVNSLKESMLNVLNQCEKSYSDELSHYGSGLAAIKNMFLEHEHYSTGRLLNDQARQSVLNDLLTVRAAKYAFAEFGLDDVKGISHVINFFHDLEVKYSVMPAKCADVFKAPLFELTSKSADHGYTDNTVNDDASNILTSKTEFVADNCVSWEKCHPESNEVVVGADGGSWES